MLFAFFTVTARRSDLVKLTRSKVGRTISMTTFFTKLNKKIIIIYLFFFFFVIIIIIIYIVVRSTAIAVLLLCGSDSIFFLFMITFCFNLFIVVVI